MLCSVSFFLSFHLYLCGWLSLWALTVALLCFCFSHTLKRESEREKPVLMRLVVFQSRGRLKECKPWTWLGFFSPFQVLSKRRVYLSELFFFFSVFFSFSRSLLLEMSSACEMSRVELRERFVSCCCFVWRGNFRCRLSALIGRGGGDGAQTLHHHYHHQQSITHTLPFAMPSHAKPSRSLVCSSVHGVTSG